MSVSKIKFSNDSPPWNLLGCEKAPYAIRRDFLGAEYVFLMDFSEILSEGRPEKHSIISQLLKKQDTTQALPFDGWVGFFSYDFLASHAGVKTSAPDELGLPATVFGKPQTILKYNDGQCEIHSTIENRCNELRDLNKVRYELAPPQNNTVTECNLDFESYTALFKQAKERILNGETYQIKISQRYCTRTHIKPLDAFIRLMQVNPSPEAFLWKQDDFSLVSCSPESVIRTANGKITTRPIGGTWDTTKNNPAPIEQFLMDAKENAEHRMLVDLERNDIGKVCKNGSVKISRLAELETYAHLHHLVSTIEGDLCDNADGQDIIRSLLPGGSITGCPKHHTMKLIDQLEPCSRSFYTGSFGTINTAGDMDFNLIIRSMLIKEHRAWTQAGGGIVSDSYPEYEYNENAIKAKALLDILHGS